MVRCVVGMRWKRGEKSTEKKRDSRLYIYFIEVVGVRYGCGRWVGVRVEGELRRFPEGDLLW